MRESGVLLHPSSLPSRYGIGDLGKNAYVFVDYLEAAGQKLWQVLPLGPAGYGESPYSPFSANAGNTLFIDLEALVEDGYLDAKELEACPDFSEDRVDFEAVKAWKLPLISKAANFFVDNIKSREFESFCSENSFWLDDYSLFKALRDYFDFSSWQEGWDKDIMLREKKAILFWKKKLACEIKEIKVKQFFFFSQWKKLKSYANKKGIRIIGDVPIFVAPDSCDVWANRDLFLLDDAGQPTCVAGVPPDYFSKDGQRWGNPLYNWKKMEEDNFSWWVNRFKSLLDFVDVIRIDHFRGLRAYWEIPVDEETAINGRWVKAPAEKLFKVLKSEIGDVEFLAEDLGFITEDVVRLREKLSFPGMKILQFAFEFNSSGEFNSENVFLPHNFDENFVVYTGTHDNNTSRGWFDSLSPEIKSFVQTYYGVDGSDISWDLIRSALSSKCKYAIIPMQDILSLDANSRMNIPSTVGNNWDWRMPYVDKNHFSAVRLKNLCSLYSR